MSRAEYTVRLKRRIASELFRIWSFPVRWKEHLLNNLPFYRMIPEPELPLFHRNVFSFVFSKRFRGSGGLRVTNEHKVIIAAAAVRLIHRLHLGYFDHIQEIVIFPSSFYAREFQEPLDGITVVPGVIGLSWQAVLESVSNQTDGKCVVAHEFAHALDLLDGELDGVPGLHPRYYRPWTDLLLTKFDELHEKDRAWHAFLAKHHVDDEAELFAVLTELYFEVPEILRRQEPEIYGMLRGFYKLEGWSAPA